MAFFSFFTAPSSPPENFVALPIDPHSVNFTWDPLPLEDQNGLIVGYVINVTVTATGRMFQLTSSTNTLRVNFLEPFTIYICTIAAQTSVGLGPFSTTVAVMTPEDGTYGTICLIIICKWKLHLKMLTELRFQF